MMDFLERGREVLNSQSFSRLLGTQLTGLSEGHAELSLQSRREFQQNYGFVHGGVIGYLADNCLTFAGATLLGHCVTSEYKINYVKPAIGDRLVARSSVLSHSLRQAVCECQVFVYDGEEATLVAVAQGTIVKVQV